MMADNGTRPHQFRRLVSSIEECITYNNTHRIYMQDGDWYLVFVEGMMGRLDAEKGTSLYHKNCTPQGGPPFVHYSRLVCQGCSATPPEGIVGAYVLHNWDQFQSAKGISNAD